MALKAFGMDNNKVAEVGGRANEPFVDLSKSKKLKNDKSEILTHPNLGATGESIFLTTGTKKAFNQLNQEFTKAPILWHFNPECYI